MYIVRALVDGSLICLSEPLPYNTALMVVDVWMDAADELFVWMEKI